MGGKLLTNYLKEVVSYRQWNMMDEFEARYCAVFCLLSLCALSSLLCDVASYRFSRVGFVQKMLSGVSHPRRDFTFPNY